MWLRPLLGTAIPSWCGSSTPRVAGWLRQPNRILHISSSQNLEELAHAAWSVPKDKCYDGGDRYRSLNRVRAEIVEGGVKVWSRDAADHFTGSQPSGSISNASVSR